MNVLVDLNNCIYLPKTGIKDINTLSGSTADAWQENMKLLPRQMSPHIYLNGVFNYKRVHKLNKMCINLYNKVLIVY